MRTPLRALMLDVGAPATVPAGAWSPLGVLSIPQGAVRWYDDDVVRSVLAWFWQAVHGVAGEIKWVSQFQLCVDFMLSGECGPTNSNGWRAGILTLHADLICISFLTRARWFSKVLRECLPHMGVKFTFHYGRPHSKAIFLHMGCLALPWMDDRLTWVDDWLLRFAPTGFHRSSTSLANLPAATKDCRFNEVWYTCA